MKEFSLPSGATLRVSLSPFGTSRALYQAILDEVKNLKLDPKADVDVNLFKDLFCTLLASKKVEAQVWECMKKATYNNIRITEDTFEPEEARQDYFEVMMNVAKENVMPFMKSLSAQYAPILEMLKKDLM